MSYKGRSPQLTVSVIETLTQFVCKLQCESRLSPPPFFILEEDLYLLLL